MFNLVSLLPKVKGVYRADADLSKNSWFGVGGDAQVLFKPKDQEDLVNFLADIDRDIKITILGNCSNVIISDDGVKGVVIKLGRGFTDMKIGDNNQSLEVGCGALCANVSRFAAVNNIGGLEFLATIPGAIGGSLAMNAGCYGKQISDVLISAKMVDLFGNVREVGVADFGYFYRGNSLKEQFIFLSAKFRTYFEDQIKIEAQISQFIAKRGGSQPIGTKTGGSTFKNPCGLKAWELIDKAGMRGCVIGGAKVSEKHCNFLINDGSASASDLILLIAKVKKEVSDKCGVELEEEIKIID